MTDALVPAEWLSWVSRLPADGGPSGAEWAVRAPRLVEEALQAWDLRPTGHARTGWTAVVLPVERAGEALALKVGWPHTESATEHIALRHWGGVGAVRLVAADPGRGALLLERLRAGRDLRGPDVDTACEVIGTLLGRLHVPAPPTVPLLSHRVRSLMTRLAVREDVPRRVRARVCGLAEELLGDPDVDATLLHADLHFENVLAADREPWLAIDPKPVAGHPGFELAPVLHNRVEDLGTGSGFRWSIRHRLAVTAEAAGVDEEAARLWSIVHTGIEALWAAEDDDATALSLHIATLKALED